MKTNYILILLVLSAFASCTKNEEIPINENNLLLGNWAEPKYENGIFTFNRVSSLLKDKGGVSFKENNVFIQRTSGWCGTPPLTFFDVKGNFKVVQNVIEVKSKSFLGNFNWRVISLNKKKLVVKKELNEQQKDYNKLKKLFNEINTLSKSVSCNNATEWNFTAYGSKACGGPQGYIAYSSQIDTVSFLKKVAIYTETEHAYNVKWKVVSTCDIPAQPKLVECKNGSPTFKY